MGKSVTIVAMGDSRRSFLEGALFPQGADPLYGEVWAINLMGAIIRADRVILMDDLDDLMARSDWNPRIFDLLKGLRVPLVTSRAHPDFPSSEAYPIDKVLASGLPYLNNTVAYAVALAIAEGVSDLWLFGCDFGYEGNPDIKEDGRACVEFWLGVAAARGVALHLPPNTSLLDSHKGGYLYGYRAQPNQEQPQCAQS